MPFEIAPQEVEVRVGPYQNVADAILRGCVGTTQCRDGSWVKHDHDGKAWAACALGALSLGGGGDGWERYPENWRAAHTAYINHYGCGPMHDNDTNGLTREAIAARFAALR